MSGRSLRLLLAGALLTVAAPSPALQLFGAYDPGASTVTLGLELEQGHPAYEGVAIIGITLDYPASLTDGVVESFVEVFKTQDPDATFAGFFLDPGTPPGPVRRFRGDYSFLADVTVGEGLLAKWTFDAPPGAGAAEFKFAASVLVESLDGALTTPPLSANLTLAIPEPSTWMLVLAGVVTLAFTAGRRRRLRP
jgi:hypothetical protein